MYNNSFCLLNDSEFNKLYWISTKFHVNFEIACMCATIRYIRFRYNHFVHVYPSSYTSENIEL